MGAQQCCSNHNVVCPQEVLTFMGGGCHASLWKGLLPLLQVSPMKQKNPVLGMKSTFYGTLGTADLEGSVADACVWLKSLDQVLDIICLEMLHNHSLRAQYLELIGSFSRSISWQWCSWKLCYRGGHLPGSPTPIVTEELL